MNLRQVIISLTPRWLVLAATDVRCLLRCSAISSRIPFQKATDKPTLIVAPHPDDETFGCGGIILLKRAAGARVCVVMLTDGEAVRSGLGEMPERVIAARRQEFVNACRALGLGADSLRWLHLPDGKLPHPGQPGFGEAVQLLQAEIASFVPQEVFCPHLLDVRPDHIAASHMTKAALGDGACSLFSYPLWMWYHASSGLRKRLDCTGAWRVDITSVLPAKREAMAAYLDAPEKTAEGDPFCGRLPWGFLENFRRPYEVFFPASEK